MNIKKYLSLALTLILSTSLIACGNSKNKENNANINNNSINNTNEISDSESIPALYINDKEINLKSQILVTQDNFLLPYEELSKNLNTSFKIEQSNDNEVIEITDLNNDIKQFLYTSSNFSYDSNTKDSKSYYHKDRPKIVSKKLYIPIDYLYNYDFYYNLENNQLFLISKSETQVDNNLRYLARLNTIQNKFDNFISAVSTLPNDKLLGFNLTPEEAPNGFIGFEGLANGLTQLNDENFEEVFQDIVIPEDHKNQFNTYLIASENFYNKALELSTSLEKDRHNKDFNKELDNLANNIKIEMIEEYENLKTAYDNLII